MPRKYKDYSGEIVGNYQVIRISGKRDYGEGQSQHTYWVKCLKCGHEHEVTLTTIYKNKRGVTEGCSYCTRGKPKLKYPSGSIVGKYLVNNHHKGKLYNVTCLKCGWMGDVHVSLLNKIKEDSNMPCMHELNTEVKYKIGEVVNDKYKIVGYVYNNKEKRIRDGKYICQCMFCKKVLLLKHSHLIHNISKSGNCRHTSYFYESDFKKGEYFFVKEACNSDFNQLIPIPKKKLHKEENESMDKFVQYVLNKNEDTIHKAVIDVIIKDKSFIDGLMSNAKAYLGFKLNMAKETDDLDIVIDQALKSDEFKNALISKGTIPVSAASSDAGLINISKPRKPNPMRSGFKMNEIVNTADVADLDTGDTEFEDFIKILKLFIKAPGNGTRDVFSKTEITRMINKGNVPRIIEKSVNIGLFTYAWTFKNNVTYTLNKDKLKDL